MQPCDYLLCIDELPKSICMCVSQTCVAHIPFLFSLNTLRSAQTNSSGICTFKPSRRHATLVASAGWRSSRLFLRDAAVPRTTATHVQWLQ